MSVNVVDLDGALGCTAAHLRGELEHTELKNTYLFFDLCLLAEELLAEDGLRAKGVQRKLRELLDALSTYSPATLVERLRPLADLPERLRASLEQALREAFESKFQPERVGAELRKATDGFLAAQEHFIDAARELEEGLEGEERRTLEAPHAELMRAVRELRAVLLGMPRGIWLP